MSRNYEIEAITITGHRYEHKSIFITHQLFAVLSTDSINPLPESMLTNHQRFVHMGAFYRSRCLSLIWVRKLLISDYSHISQGLHLCIWMPSYKTWAFKCDRNQCYVHVIISNKSWILLLLHAYHSMWYWNFHTWIKINPLFTIWLLPLLFPITGSISHGVMAELAEL